MMRDSKVTKITEDRTTVKSSLCTSGHIFTEIQKKIFVSSFLNGDDVRSRNYMSLNSHLHFCGLGRKIELIRVANHKGQHFNLQSTVERRHHSDYTNKGQNRYIQQCLQKCILLVKIKLTNGTSVQG